MTEKQLLFVNLGGVITFGLFLLLSLLIQNAASTQHVMILLSEIIGGLTFAAAIISIVYMKTRKRWFPVSVLSFLSIWFVYMIGYEIGIDSSSSHSWIWFLIFYITAGVSIYFLKKSYQIMEGNFKLFPAFFMFFNSMLIVYMIFLTIWWNLPFL
ncbi:hypothetical protein Q7A53_06405 [Halobacillus rhizosphaerae]|uniref:hypothetical protein n=1 Tax=Halobacillus rhizosphaerae TaxID=3064889 RepID=UPI00398B0FC0